MCSPPPYQRFTGKWAVRRWFGAPSALCPWPAPSPELRAQRRGNPAAGTSNQTNLPEGQVGAQNNWQWGSMGLPPQQTPPYLQSGVVQAIVNLGVTKPCRLESDWFESYTPQVVQCIPKDNELWMNVDERSWFIFDYYCLSVQWVNGKCLSFKTM